MQLNVQQILNKLSLQEKANIVNGASFFTTASIDHFSIRSLQLLDGGTGINFEQLFHDKKDALESKDNLTPVALDHVINYFFESSKLTEQERILRDQIAGIIYKDFDEEYAPACFPPGILLGATFQPQLVYDVGVSLGNEAITFGIDILLGTPNVNIHRDPRNGRIFEGYSEDPFLVSTLAKELVKGVQSTGVSANVKHFAANNQETNRVGIDEIIPIRALREIYFPGFESCVREGKVKTIMSAYNKINGVPCTENAWMLNDVLRGEWGFDGLVVSDWGAVYHPVEALAAGNDLAMPGPIDGTEIVEAVETGKLLESVLDQAVLRVLELSCNNEKRKCEESLQSIFEQSTKAAYNAAVEGIVLLKNENDMFPLSSIVEGGSISGKIAVLGSGARKLLDCGKGSARIITNRTSDFVGLLREELGEENVITLDSEVSKDEMKLFQWLMEKQVEKVLVIASENGMEGNDRNDLFLNNQDDKLLKALGHYKTINRLQLALLLNVCGPIDISNYDTYLDGIFCMFLPGMEGGHALADLITGKVCPSGKLPLTFPKRYEDTPTMINFPGDGYNVHYGEGIYVGYRYYEKKKIEPQYYFGFGLSYTKFIIDHLLVKQDTFTEKLEFTVDIQNVGRIAGAEVIQIYIHDLFSTLPKPEKELRAFQKVYLKPGEKKKVGFVLTKKDFASFDVDYDKWIAEEGYYDILVSTSADPKSVVEKTRVYLEAKTEYSYGLESTVKTFMEHKDLKIILHEFSEEISLDWQIVLDTYQYTPNTNISALLRKEGILVCNEIIKDFRGKVDKIKKD